MATSVRPEPGLASVFDNGWSAGLVAVTYGLELVSMFARWFVIKAVTAVIVLFLGLFLGFGSLLSSPIATLSGADFGRALFVLEALNSVGNLLALSAAFVTPAVSLLMLFQWTSGGGYFTRWVLGARNVSLRERPIVQAALQAVVARAPYGSKEPRYVFVIPKLAELNAFVIGDTLFLTQPLITSEYLQPLIAHELGHLNNGDSIVTRALRYLVTPPLYLLSNSVGQVAPGSVIASAASGNAGGCLLGGALWFFSLLLSLSGGGFGLWLLNPGWVWFWRDRDYKADAFAYACGQGQALIEYLDKHKYLDVATPFFLTNTPYTEERIDKLLEYQQLASAGQSTVMP